MKKKIFFLGIVVVGSLARMGSAAAAESFLRHRAFDVRMGLGGTIDPGGFALRLGAEGHINSFFSLGPLFQGSWGDGPGVYIGTLQARLTAPLYPTKRVQISLHGGPGFMVRDSGSYAFTDFAFTTGLDLDVFVWDGLALGAGAILNVTGSTQQRIVASFLAGVSYHFF
jgi:hypothetical protein